MSLRTSGCARHPGVLALPTAPPQPRRPYGTSHPPRRRTLLSSRCVNAGSGSRPKPTSSAATAWSEARKELIEKLGRADLCPCGSGLIFRACCLRSGRYEGVNRHYYFQGLNTAPPPGGAQPCVAERPRLQPSKLIRRVRPCASAPASAPGGGCPYGHPAALAILACSPRRTVHLISLSDVPRSRNVGRAHRPTARKGVGKSGE
jgi:hypothetical protein